MESSVRVVVANRPRLLRELVLSTLSGQGGIEVVGEAENEQDVPSLVAATKPDFLRIALEESRRSAVVRFAFAKVSGAANHRGGAEHECGDFLLGFVRHPLENDGSERGSIAGSGAEQRGSGEGGRGLKHKRKTGFHGNLPGAILACLQDWWGILCSD